MTVRQFRILVVLTVVAGFLGGGVSNLLLRGAPAAAQTQAEDVVTAKKFRLVDDKGRGRASLGTDDAGQPELEFYDATGQRRLSLGLHPDPDLGADYAGLDVYDAAGSHRASLGLVGLLGGVARLTLWDAADGKAMATLNVFDGTTGLALDDAANKERACLQLLEDGSPDLTLRDAAGNDRAVVGCAATKNKQTDAVTTDAESTLTLFKANGDVLWQEP